MVSVESHTSSFYHPPQLAGLEKVVLYPGLEAKKNAIPNSTIWFFSNGSRYMPEILADDVGCGIAAFMLSEIDHRAAADIFCDYLQGKNILGRGNHFIDICSSIKTYDGTHKPHSVLLVHTDGKRDKVTVPQTVAEAKVKQIRAFAYREELGYELARKAGASSELIGNWTHNSVEEGDKLIYRKGVIKATSGRPHILPAHLGAEVLFYTVHGSNLPPYSSMPHATGRSAPKGEGKVTIEQAEELRERVYIPAAIQTTSLRTEHPSCFNNFDEIIQTLGGHIISLGEAQILAYVGKV